MLPCILWMLLPRALIWIIALQKLEEDCEELSNELIINDDEQVGPQWSITIYVH